MKSTFANLKISVLFVLCLSCSNVAKAQCKASFDTFSITQSTVQLKSTSFTTSSSPQWEWSIEQAVLGVDYDYTQGSGQGLSDVHIWFFTHSQYSVCLFLTDSNCKDTFCQSVSYLYSKPQCDAYFQPYNNGLFSQFSGPKDYSTDLPYKNYKWSFGDGVVSILQNDTHTYKSGTYTACLIVSDSMCRDTFCHTILAVDSPVSVVDYYASTAANPLQISFVNLSYSSNPSVSYHWDFGDGQTSNQKHVVHTFQTHGDHDVTLVKIDSGIRDSFTNQIWAGYPVVYSGYHYVQDSLNSKQFTFTDVSILNGLSNISYLWDFGDGQTSTQQNTQHTFSKRGLYQVTLTIADTQLGLNKSSWQYVYANRNVSQKGKVYYGGSSNLANSGKVWLIESDTAKGTLYAKDSAVLKGGNYSFITPTGNYLLKAALDTNDTQYQQHLPTYFKNSLRWDSASLLTLTSDTTNLNINLIQGNNPGGLGFIGGYTSQGANKTEGVGDPIPGVEIILYDDARKPVAYTYSDAQGKYSFNNLKYGTYEIVPEILGKSSFGLSVTISAGQPSVQNVVVEVNSKYASVALGIVRSQQSIDNGIKVYPNPANSILNIEVEGNTSFLTTVTDMQGRSTGLSATQEGNRMRLDVSSLATGMYILNLTAKDGSNYRQRFVKQ